MSAADDCRTCGEELHPNSRSCSNCGAKRGSPANSPKNPDGSDGYSDDFDYDSFIEREFNSGSRLKPSGLSTFWWVAAILVLLTFLYLVIAGRF